MVATPLPGFAGARPGLRAAGLHPAAGLNLRLPFAAGNDTRVIRLCEVLLHGGTHVGGWTAKEIHQSVLTTFGLSERSYGLNQLRYDLRKLKGHGLLERDGSRYAYRLTSKGVQVGLLFLLFHKRRDARSPRLRQRLAEPAGWVPGRGLADVLVTTDDLGGIRHDRLLAVVHDIIRGDSNGWKFSDHHYTL
jgi:hypothetical protein